MNEKPLVLCLEDVDSFASIVEESTSDFTVEIATNGLVWAKKIVEENKKYVAIVLDGQFPIATIWDSENEVIAQELLKINEQIKAERKLLQWKSSVPWIVFINFLIKRKIDIKKLFWILNSDAHNQNLQKELEHFWVHPDKISSIYDKGLETQSLQEVFARLKATIGL
jgi:CheY-like chemotaxis protein